MSWFILAWQRATDFSGRSRRKEYWYFNLFNGIVFLFLFLFAIPLGEQQKPSMLPLGFLFAYSLVIMIPGLAVTIRRLHDIGDPECLGNERDQLVIDGAGGIRAKVHLVRLGLAQDQSRRGHALELPLDLADPALRTPDDVVEVEALVGTTEQHREHRLPGAREQRVGD